jgi:hypothetical protein
VRFGRRPLEERQALRAEKARRKEETRERLRARMVEHRRAEEEKQTRALLSLLGPDEEVLGLFETAEALMKKYVLFTPKRLLVASVSDPASTGESIPYRSISSFATSNFITKDVRLTVTGRRDNVELSFDNADLREQVLALLNAHVL